MIDESPNLNSADKILEAATKLFAMDSFAAVSIKQISVASGVNSALISYYFGGKKNLYQEVLYTEAEKFLKLQDKIRQQQNPYNIHLIYRELLTPQPMFENYVRSKLYRIHQFMTELVEEAIACGEIVADIKATHVAFTMEGIIMFFFLMHSHICELGNFKNGAELDYLLQALNTYLASLSKK